MRREVVVLCATEITNWGALVCAFLVASSTIAASEGWGRTPVLGAFTVAQLVAGLAGLWVGRRIDAVGPRAVMTIGSILGAVALAVIASSTSLFAFFAGWVIAGFAMAAVLYAPAFAAITGGAGSDVRRRIRALTARGIWQFRRAAETTARQLSAAPGAARLGLRQGSASGA